MPAIFEWSMPFMSMPAILEWSMPFMSMPDIFEWSISLAGLVAAPCPMAPWSMPPMPMSSMPISGRGSGVGTGALSPSASARVPRA